MFHVDRSDVLPAVTYHLHCVPRGRFREVSCSILHLYFFWIGVCEVNSDRQGEAWSAYRVGEWGRFGYLTFFPGIFGPKNHDNSHLLHW